MDDITTLKALEGLRKMVSAPDKRAKKKMRPVKDKDKKLAALMILQRGKGE